jgi:methylated-DNA-[protein]-cysteine S-methyltransferase
MTYFCYCSSPLGPMTLQATEFGLCGAWFEAQVTLPKQLGKEDADHPILSETSAQLADYFGGLRKTFDLPLAATGTAFQRRVWQTLTTIAYADTWSYSQLAVAIGNPQAARAVGLANSKNPISIIVPCHRVVAQDGKLTGYAGGMSRKAYLLQLERDGSSSWPKAMNVVPDEVAYCDLKGG